MAEGSGAHPCWCPSVSVEKRKSGAVPGEDVYGMGRYDEDIHKLRPGGDWLPSASLSRLLQDVL